MGVEVGEEVTEDDASVIDPIQPDYEDDTSDDEEEE